MKRRLTLRFRLTMLLVVSVINAGAYAYQTRNSCPADPSTMLSAQPGWSGTHQRPAREYDGRVPRVPAFTVTWPLNADVDDCVPGFARSTMS